MNVAADLIHRRTIRVFRPAPIPAQTVRELVEIARWTGSARNRQPWRFVAVTDPELREGISRLGAYAGHLAAAPLVLVILSPAEPLRDTEFDIGRVAQSLTVAATSLGLGSCLATLYPDENARAAADLVGAGPEWTARHALALGHPGPRVRGGVPAIPQGRLEVDELLSFR